VQNSAILNLAAQKTGIAAFFVQKTPLSFASPTFRKQEK
jgi:hypothetical protein